MRSNREQINDALVQELANSERLQEFNIGDAGNPQIDIGKLASQDVAVLEAAVGGLDQDVRKECFDMMMAGKSPGDQRKIVRELVALDVQKNQEHPIQILREDSLAKTSVTEFAKGLDYIKDEQLVNLVQATQNYEKQEVRGSHSLEYGKPDRGARKAFEAVVNKMPAELMEVFVPVVEYANNNENKFEGRKARETSANKDNFVGNVVTFNSLFNVVGAKLPQLDAPGVDKVQSIKTIGKLQGFINHYQNDQKFNHGVVEKVNATIAPQQNTAPAAPQQKSRRIPSWTKTINPLVQMKQDLTSASLTLDILQKNLNTARTFDQRGGTEAEPGAQVVTDLSKVYSLVSKYRNSTGGEVGQKVADLCDRAIELTQTYGGDDYKMMTGPERDTLIKNFNNAKPDLGHESSFRVEL